MKPVVTLVVYCLLMVLCALFPSSISANIALSNEELIWKLKSSKSNVEIYVAKDDDNVQWVKARTKVAGNYWSILNLLRDIDVAPQWVESISSIALIASPDYKTDIVHSVIAAPWPFSNREMVTISKVTLAIQQQSMTIQVSQTDCFSEDNNLQMMENVQGQWIAQQVSKEHVEIIWIGTGLAGGNIPDWLSFSQMKKSTRRTFQNLRKKISQKKYQGKPLAYLKSAQKGQNPP